MLVLVWAFTLFNLAAALASLGQAMRLLRKTERAHWRSRTLHGLAVAIAWSFPIAALAGVTLGWLHFQQGARDAIPLLLAPIVWLFVMGIVFAVADFAEDGVLGNARSRDN